MIMSVKYTLCNICFSMGSVVAYLEQAVPGAYVTSLMVGDNVVQDTENGFFLNINKQIDMVCQMVNSDEKLKSNISSDLLIFAQKLGSIFLTC